MLGLIATRTHINQLIPEHITCICWVDTHAQTQINKSIYKNTHKRTRIVCWRAARIHSNLHSPLVPPEPSSPTPVSQRFVSSVCFNWGFWLPGGCERLRLRRDTRDWRIVCLWSRTGRRQWRLRFLLVRLFAAVSKLINSSGFILWLWDSDFYQKWTHTFDRSRKLGMASALPKVPFHKNACVPIWWATVAGIIILHERPWGIYVPTSKWHHTSRIHGGPDIISDTYSAAIRYRTRLCMWWRWWWCDVCVYEESRVRAQHINTDRRCRCAVLHQQNFTKPIPSTAQNGSRTDEADTHARLVPICESLVHTGGGAVIWRQCSWTQFIRLIARVQLTTPLQSYKCECVVFGFLWHIAEKITLWPPSPETNGNIWITWCTGCARQNVRPIDH